MALCSSTFVVAAWAFAVAALPPAVAARSPEAPLPRATATGVSPAASAENAAHAFAMEDAVALALRRSRKVVAARLDIDAALVDEVAARLLPNPRVDYALGNLVLGAGNPQDQGLRPSFFEQNSDTVGVSQGLDLFRKRHGRLRVAQQHGETARALVEDAMREVAYLTRSRFAEVLREQAELALMEETRRGYTQTVALMRRREAAGDIARTDLDKVELEALRYTQLLLHAQRELADARAALAQVLAFGDAAALPAHLDAPTMPNGEAHAPDGDALLERALAQRPDVRAALSESTGSVLSAVLARSEAFPDLTMGLSYTRSHFMISGDNPHTLGLQVGIDLPVFDRNQAGRAQAALARRRADNAIAQLALDVTHDVTRAVRGWKVASEALHVFEDGGMLERAQRAREVAQRSFAAGATSLLELLEAERTYLETRADYLRTLDSWRQAHIDVAYATGGSPP